MPALHYTGGVPEALESLSAERRYGPGMITMEEPRRGQPGGERSGHCVERRPHIRATRPQSRLRRAGHHSIAPASRRASSVPGQIAAGAGDAMASEVPFLPCVSTTMTLLYSRGRSSSRVGQPVRNSERIERRSRTRSRHARACAIEELENRMLLSGTAQFDHVVFGPPTAAPNIAIKPAAGYTVPYVYSPAEIRSAYGVDSIQLGSVVGNGSGQTIAIVDAYDDPALVSSTASNFLSSDLHQFDVEFRLPDPPSFLKLDENGGTNYPSTDPSGPGNSWAVEVSLDVEWAHAIAPEANIVLVEANSANWNDLATAVSTAANRPGVSVVSMSWGAGDFAGEASFDPLFTTPASHTGVTFVASAGDGGAPGDYPAFSPNVVAVGGTTLTAPGGIYQGETAWSLNGGWGTGGGQSFVETEPSYQTGVQQSGWRQMPDVAFDADPTSGVPVCDTYDFGASTPWATVGGTSLSSPCWAGLIAIADQLRASLHLPALDGPTQTLPA